MTRMSPVLEALTPHEANALVMSLRACAERLGVSRETVRVHLRRLRALRRMVMARGQPERS